MYACMLTNQAKNKGNHLAWKIFDTCEAVPAAKNGEPGSRATAAFKRLEKHGMLTVKNTPPKANGQT